MLLSSDSCLVLFLIPPDKKQLRLQACVGLR